MRIPPTSFPTQPTIPEEVDRTSEIKVASWTILGITVVVFLTRQILKAIVFQKLALDDLFILLGVVFAIGLSVTTLILASQGLGVFGFLTIERADILMKGYYASELLYISAVCFTKISLLVLFYNIVEVQRLHRRIVLGFGIFILTWSAGSLLAVAFQCGLPRPWEMMTLRCFNKRVFWIVYCIIDMSTEVSIIMLSVNLVAYLKVRFTRKFAVVACFAPRALVLGAALVRLIWLYPITPHGNPQYRLWLPVIIAQVQVCLSICTACIPYMVPFFRSLETNLRRTYSVRSRDIRREGYQRTQSSLWSRRHRKSKVFSSWDSTAVASLQYERVPQISPHIPTPTPMSPLTPPQMRTPPSSCSSISTSPGDRGLNISIPKRTPTIDISGPQTASSFALSPTCTSPQPLLYPQSFVASRKAPSPPPKTYSSIPSTQSSAFPSPVPTPRTQRFSLFPQQRSNSVSPKPQQDQFASQAVTPIRGLRSQTISSPSRHPSTLRPNDPLDGIVSRTRSSSNAQASKSSNVSLSKSPPLNTNFSKFKQRPASVQELTSPMGAAINSYFNDTAWSNPTALPAQPLSSAQRQRNQKILLPANSTRIATSPPASSARSPTPNDIIFDELFLPRDSILMTRTSRSNTMPSVQDVRSSPKCVNRSTSHYVQS